MDELQASLLISAPDPTRLFRLLLGGAQLSFRDPLGE